jgi:hypothetical protein
LVLAMLLAVVMCWVGERPSFPKTALDDGPTLERSPPDTCPVGKLADSDGESEAESGSADDSDGDALVACEATLGFVRVIGVPEFEHRRELNDWRVRSSIGARGPPVG